MRPDVSGVWKANLERSKMIGPAPKAALARIIHSEPELAVEMLITRADSREDCLRFRALTCGEEVTNQVGGVEMRSRSRWVGSELLIESWVNLGGRQAHFCDYWSISGDGQTLTMEHRGDDLAGQIEFLERAVQETS